MLTVRVEFTSVRPMPLSATSPVPPLLVITTLAWLLSVSVDPVRMRTLLPVLLWALMVLNPGTPENIGLLNTVITDPCCIDRPSPLLKVFSTEPASRSRPAFELTDTPMTGLPEALIVPPNDTRWAPDTTVNPTARLLFVVIDVAESLRNALPLVEI